MLKRGIVVFIGTLIGTLSLSASVWADYRERFRDAQDLHQVGQYTEALEAYETLFIETGEEGRWVGPRSSYLLAAWRELGEHYSPALVALIDHQQRLLEKAGSDDFETSDFSDLYSINRVLEENEKTLAVFLQAHQNQPKRAKSFYFYTGTLLIDAGEYEVYLHYNQDPIYALENARNHREHILSNIRQGKFQPDHREGADRRFETTLESLIGALSFTERKEELAEVMKRAEAYYGEDEVAAIHRRAINR